MTDDIKNRPVSKKAPPAPNKQRPLDLGKMAARLSETMHIDGCEQDILHRQAALLDHFFMQILDKTVNREKLDGSYAKNYLDSSYLELALRVQKQCTDTIKAAGALDYMKSIVVPPVKTKQPPPALPKMTNEMKDHEID